MREQRDKTERSKGGALLHMQDPETEVICVWNEQGESEERVKSCVCGAMSKLSFLKSLKKSHLGLLTRIELDGDKVGPTSLVIFTKLPL